MEGERSEKRGEARGSTERDSSVAGKKRRSSSNLSKTSKDWLRGGGAGFGLPEKKYISNKYNKNVNSYYLKFKIDKNVNSYYLKFKIDKKNEWLYESAMRS